MEELTKLTITTKSPEQASALIEILMEMKRATEKHPEWPTCPVHRAAILSEEAGEVIREANHIREGHGDLKALRMELIQTAGTCIRMINIMDAEKSENDGVIPIPDFEEKPKGQGIFALFNHETDKRRFSNQY